VRWTLLFDFAKIAGWRSARSPLCPTVETYQAFSRKLGKGYSKCLCKKAGISVIHKLSGKSPFGLNLQTVGEVTVAVFPFVTVAVCRRGWLLGRPSHGTKSTAGLPC
jgi:hypothetical protein